MYGKEVFNMFALLSSTSSGGSLADLLSAATTLLEWFITSMGKFLQFIVSNPVCLMMFLILLVGSAVAMLFRIWHSA